MAAVTADRAKESSTTTGTGAFTLAGAVAEFQSFAAAFGTGTTANISYCIHGGAQWEVGKGSFNGTTMVLTRTTVEANSNDNTSPVNFSAGTKNVFATFTAADAAAVGGGGGGALSYLGYNTVGGSTVANLGAEALKKITAPSNGILVNIALYFQATSTQQLGLSVAVLGDTAGSPNIVIASAQTALTGVITTSPRWMRVPVGLEVTSGDYWLAFMLTGGGGKTLYYDSGTDLHCSAGGDVRDTGMGETFTDSTRKYSLRAAFLSTA